MGFQEGEEDESLLTCIVCLSPFGMTSRFCGECGSSREQALGVERVRPSQKIRPVEPFQSTEPETDYSEIFDGTGSYSQQPTVRKPSRWTLFRISLSMRIENLAFFLQYHGKKIATLGIVFFLASSYTMTQSVIFLNTSPVTVTDRYVAAVGSRDTNYFLSDKTLTPDIKNTRLLPAKFNKWPDAETASWINYYSWNGWFSSGMAQVEPGADQITVSVPLVAKTKKKLGIFREDTWMIKGPMATVKIIYPKDPSLPIYINGIYAGTVGNPALPAGTYYAMPGPLSIGFGSNGEKTDNDVNMFIDASGQYEV